MSENTLVYDPVAPCLTQPQQSQRALEALAGKTIGFIDNSKPNFHFLADDLGELLMSRYGVAKVVKRAKRTASAGAPEAVLNELAEECDAVITGSGD